MCLGGHRRSGSGSLYFRGICSLDRSACTRLGQPRRLMPPTQVCSISVNFRLISCCYMKQLVSKYYSMPFNWQNPCFLIVMVLSIGGYYEVCRNCSHLPCTKWHDNTVHSSHVYLSLVFAKQVTSDRNETEKTVLSYLIASQSSSLRNTG